jgi:hypothetical protein
VPRFGTVNLFVDGAGTLYALNGIAHTITEYPAGQTTPSVTLSTGPNNAERIVVGVDGTIYVSQFLQNTVLEFDPGATSPSRALSIVHPSGLTLDASNNLYVTNNEPVGLSLGHIARFAPGALAGTDLGITASGRLTDIKIDNSGNILVANLGAQTVDVYTRGRTTPSRSINLASTPPADGIALDQARSMLYVADNFGEVPVYDYNSGSLRRDAFFAASQIKNAIAITPAAAFGPSF